MRNLLSAICLFTACLLYQTANAQQDSAAATRPEKFVTKHSIKIDNKIISYTATVGTLILKNEKDEPSHPLVTLLIPKMAKRILAKGRSHLVTMAAPALLPCGCTWASWGQEEWL